MPPHPIQPNHPQLTPQVLLILRLALLKIPRKTYFRGETIPRVNVTLYKCIYNTLHMQARQPVAAVKTHMWSDNAVRRTKFSLDVPFGILMACHWRVTGKPCCSIVFNASRIDIGLKAAHKQPLQISNHVLAQFPGPCTDPKP